MFSPLRRTFSSKKIAAAVLWMLVALTTSSAFLILSTPVPAAAQVVNGTTNVNGTTGGRTQLQNPLGTSDIHVLIARAITIFTGIAGSIALAVFVYGGFLMVTAEGNDEKIKKGKGALIWAVIGLVIMFGAYAILNAFFGALGVQ